MGLDTSASNSPEDVELTREQTRAFEEADIQLCGGIFSGGARSLRGKVYFNVVIEVTGESLYQDWIPPATVREMYRALADCDPDEVAEESDIWQVTAKEVIGLRKFFTVCAEHELLIRALLSKPPSRWRLRPDGSRAADGHLGGFQAGFSR